MQNQVHFLRALVVAAGVAMVIATVDVRAAEEIAADDGMAFARGAQAWASNCARCHNMRDAAELRDDQWRAVVAHMRVRAGLTGTESQEILMFLQRSN